MKSIIHKINKITGETSLVVTLVALLLVSGLVTCCSACHRDKKEEKSTTLPRIKLKLDSKKTKKIALKKGLYLILQE